MTRGCVHSDTSSVGTVDNTLWTHCGFPNRITRLYRHAGRCMGHHRARRNRSAWTRPERSVVTRVNERWSMVAMADPLFRSHREAARNYGW